MYKTKLTSSQVQLAMNHLCKADSVFHLKENLTPQAEAAMKIIQAAFTLLADEKEALISLEIP